MNGARRGELYSKYTYHSYYYAGNPESAAKSRSGSDKAEEGSGAEEAVDDLRKERPSPE